MVRKLHIINIGMPMRKFILLMGMCLFIPVFATAQALSTTDKFTITAVGEIQPGGDLTVLTVGLDGSQIYTAYNMDITLPEGLVFAQDEFGDIGWLDPYAMPPIYPLEGRAYTHSLSGALQTNGNFRLECHSTKNADFTATSGELFYVNVKASAYAKPGTYTIKMTGLNLTTNVDGKAQKYIPDGDLNTGDITIGTQAKVSVAIKAANKYSTCILPFAYAVPSGIKAYSSLGVEGDVLRLAEVAEMEAYKPYILYSETDYTATWQGTVDPALYPEEKAVTVGGLTGVVANHTALSGYVLQNQGTGACFHPIGTTSFVIPEGRCYLSVAPQSESHLRFEVTPTDITDTLADDAAEEVIYDLFGRRVTAPQSGKIYISTLRGAFIHK